MIDNFEQVKATALQWLKDNPMIGEPIEPPFVLDEPECDHEKVIPEFDAEEAKNMTSGEVRKKYPRFFGRCPDCDYYGVIYTSFEHYLAGDY